MLRTAVYQLTILVLKTVFLLDITYTMNNCIPMLIQNKSAFTIFKIVYYNIEIGQHLMLPRYQTHITFVQANIYILSKFSFTLPLIHI